VPDGLATSAIRFALAATGAKPRSRVLDVLQGRLEASGLSERDWSVLRAAAVADGVGGLMPSPTGGRASRAPEEVVGAVLAGYATRRAVNLIEQAGIACAVLKGVAVAELAWKNPSLRSQVDVDVLVRRRDLNAAAEALRGGGLAGKTKLEGPHWHHLVLRSLTPPGPNLELHHELSLDLPVLVDTEDLLARRIRVSTPDGELPTLSHEDAMVYLALHAAVHVLDRLSWIVDLAGYVQRQPIVWRIAVERARCWGVALPVELGWSAAAHVFGAAIPPDAIRGLGVSWPRRALSWTLLAGANRAPGPSRVVAARAFRLALLPSPQALVATLQRKVHARAEARSSAAG
jgi:hypothetical protein